jgi:hypothetical protein
MSAVYSSYRDVSGILTPGMAWVVLLFAPLSGIFAAGGVALLGAWVLANSLPNRLGQTGSQRQARPAPVTEPFVPMKAQQH